MSLLLSELEYLPSRLSKVRIALEEMVISSLNNPSTESGSSVVARLATDLLFCVSSVISRRLLLPNALYPRQLTGWHLPKQTRILHWKRILSLEGNLKALKLAIKVLVSELNSHSPKMLGSVAQPFSSVTMYSFSTFSSIVLATQLRAKPP